MTYIPPATQRELDNPAPEGQGLRHNQTRKIAYSLAGNGFSADEIVRMNTNGLPEDEVRKLAEWAISQNPEPSKPSSLSQTSNNAVTYRHQIGNGNQTVNDTPGRYCPADCKWNLERFLDGMTATPLDIGNASPVKVPADPREQASLLLSQLYQPGELVNIVTNATTEGKPGNRGETLTVTEWLLTQIMVIPTLGKLEVGVKDEGKDDSGEIRKKLTTAIEQCEPIVFLDNLKGHLSSPALEAFITAGEWKDRKLGVNQQIRGRNLAQVFITGNGLTVSGDIRRRSLFIELHLEVERAEDRAIRRPLDEDKITAMRPNILAALWAVVRQWQEQGRPKPAKTKGGFESWSEIVGGIVQAAGFGCPLETAEVAVAADTDHDDMRRLVAAMDSERHYEFSQLVELARQQDCFEGILGGEELDRRDKARLGKLFQRYHRRQVGDKRFWFDGKGHARRYWVETVKPTGSAPGPDGLHGQHGQHGISPEYAKNDSSQPDPQTMQTMQPCKEEPPPPCPDRLFGLESATAPLPPGWIGAQGSASTPESLFDPLIDPDLEACSEN
jgi:hypothetical protein